MYGCIKLNIYIMRFMGCSVINEKDKTIFLNLSDSGINEGKFWYINQKNKKLKYIYHKGTLKIIIEV